MEATRAASNRQEEYIAKKFGGRQTCNSGAGHWVKGDVVIKDASLLVECKTVMSEKKSVSVQKEWIEKNLKEAKENHLFNSCIAISFDPSGKENYYIIDEKLFSFLVENLKNYMENS